MSLQHSVLLLHVGEHWDRNEVIIIIESIAWLHTLTLANWCVMAMIKVSWPVMDSTNKVVLHIIFFYLEATHNNWTDELILPPSCFLRQSTMHKMGGHVVMAVTFVAVVLPLQIYLSCCCSLFWLVFSHPRLLSCCCLLFWLMFLHSLVCVCTASSHSNGWCPRCLLGHWGAWLEWTFSGRNYETWDNNQMDLKIMSFNLNVN